MKRSYQVPGSLATLDQLRAFGQSHQTHEAVVAAIFAICDSKRTAEAIWQHPTAAEWDNVCTAVKEYVTHGDFPAEIQGHYPWGQGAVEVPPSPVRGSPRR